MPRCDCWQEMAELTSRHMAGVSLFLADEKMKIRTLASNVDVRYQPMSAFQQLHSTYHDVDSGDGLQDNYNNSAVRDLGHKRGHGGRHSDCDGGGDDRGEQDGANAGAGADAKDFGACASSCLVASQHELFVSVYCASRIRRCRKQIMAQQGRRSGASAATHERCSKSRRPVAVYESNVETSGKQFTEVCIGQTLNSSENEALQPAPTGASSAEPMKGDDAAESMEDPTQAAVRPGQEEELYYS